MHRKQISLTTLILAGLMAGSASAANAQGYGFEYSRQDEQESARFEYHSRYYDRGYDRQEFRYHSDACQRQRQGGLGLGIGLGGTPLVSASVGGRLTECDRHQFDYAHSHAFQGGEPVYWHNPESYRRGVVRPGRHYRRGGRECARGEAEIYGRDGSYQGFEFESCRDGSGRWRYVGETG